jgi:hypothetical protein
VADLQHAVAAPGDEPELRSAQPREHVRGVRQRGSTTSCRASRGTSSAVPAS